MITNKEYRNVLLVFGLFSSGMFVFGFWAGDKHCKESPVENNYCPAPRVEKVEVPVGNQEVVEKFIQCRRDLIEVSEAFNSEINCHDRTCN